MARSTRNTTVMLLLVALVVTACTGSAGDTTSTAASVPSDGSSDTTVTTDSTNPTEPVGDPVELSVTMWAAGDAIDEVWGGIATDFAAAHPQVSAVNIEFVPFSRYHDVLNVRLASGEVQDAGWLFPPLAPKYIRQGDLFDVRTTFENTEGYDLDGVEPRLLGTWLDPDNNAIYGYPFPQSPWLFFWNRDMFAAAGVTTPEELLAEGNWTWETLAETTKAVKDSGVSDWGLAWQVELYAPTEGWRLLDILFSAYGATPWSEDGATCLLNSAESQAALGQLWSMVYEDETFPGPGITNPQFWAGESAMGIFHNAAAVPQSQGVGFDYGVVPQPSGPAGWAPVTASAGLVAFADGANPDLAAEFIAYATNPENSRRLATLHLSPRTSILDTELFTSQLDITAEEAQTAILDTIDAGSTTSFIHPNWEAVYRESNSVISAQLWQPDADIPAVLDAACGAIADLLG